MFNKPLIINNDGKIFIFPKNTYIDEQQLQILEYKLRQFTTSINYNENIHEFEFDIYSIWSLLIMGEEKLDEFLLFLKENSINELPESLLNHIQDQKGKFKQVLITEEIENIIVKVLRGDLESILNKTFKKELKFNRKRNVYIGNKNNSSKITEKLLRNEILVKLDNYLESVNNIPLNFSCSFNSRYYQREAVNLITSRKQENGVIFMPPGSGKSYVALKLIQYFRVPTLIICNNSEEYWHDFIVSNISSSGGNYVSIFNGKNIFTPITICSYQMAKDSILDKLKELQWGLIFFDDAHRAPADTYSKTLYIKSKYKFALAATLSRGDGRGYMLYDIIGPRLYNITWQELRIKRFYKEISYNFIISNLYSKLSICKMLVEKHKGKKILICSFDTTQGKNISKTLNIPHLYGKSNEKTKKAIERETISSFILNQVNVICISSILQRLQISDIDILIAITHKQGSVPEETFRIGRAASCYNQQKTISTTIIYSIVTNDEIKHFGKRLVSVKEYISGPYYIDEEIIMAGEY